MVCLCCDYLDGCFAVVVMADAFAAPDLLGPADTLPPLLVVSSRCFAAVELLLLVDAWHPLVVFVVSVGGLGDVVFYVGSSMLGRLVGW